MEKSSDLGRVPSEVPNFSKCESETWMLKALPSEWKPVLSPSTAVQKVCKKREIEHNNHLMRLESEMANINVRVENRIRLKSEWIKEQYRCLQNQTDNKLIGKLKKDPSLLAKYQRKDFAELTKSIQEFHENYTDQVQDFHSYLLQLEQTRCWHFKNILRTAFTNMHETAFKLPRELQEFFEYKILHINQITLSNLRCYHEICATLQLQGENSIRRWLLAVASLKYQWKAAQKQQATRKLISNFQMPSDPELLQKEIAKNVNIQFDLNLKGSKHALNHVMLLPLQPDDVNQWCDEVEAEIKDLSYAARTLVNLYRGAIVQVFNGYMEEFQNISEKLIDCGAVDDLELEHFNKIVAVPIIDEISSQFSSNISYIKSLWKDISTKLDEQTKKTVSFLRGAAAIWNEHFERTDTLKATILKELEQVVTKNSQLSEQKETNICIIIDKMRQQSTANNLNKELDNLNKLLDELQEEYMDGCRKELQIISKYPEMAQEETNLLVLELRRFLNAFPKEAVEIRRASRFDISEEPESTLPSQIKMCEYEVYALANWMLGLWEAIDKYLLTCEAELAEKAEEWKKTHVKGILKRLEVKVAFHKARYNRTRINIYDTRLAELKEHIERFERHKTEIGIQMQEMSTISATFENKLRMLAEKDCEDLMTTALKKMETAKTSQLVHAITSEVDTVLKKLQALADVVMSEYSNVITSKQNEILKSNYEFRKSIKFFSEDGSFNQDEAKRYFNEIKKLEATLEKKVQVLHKEVETKYHKLKITIQQKFTNLLNKLNLLREELEFREQILKEIRKVQSDIKIGIYDKKYTLKRFSAEIRRLAHPVFANIENFSRFKTNFNDLVTRISGFQMYLVKRDSDTISSTSSSSRSVVKQRHSMTPKSSRSRSSRLGSKASGRSRMSSATSSAGTDYANLLFPIRPPDTCTFISEHNTALYETVDTIQQMAKKFYRKDRIVQNGDMLQLTLTSFMDEILQKFKRYREQLDMAWMDIINETLKLLKQLLHFTWKQYEVIFRNFCEMEIKIANEEKSNKIRTVENTIERYEQDNKNLHGRLKVHFGNIKNKQMLDLILKEVNQQKLKIRTVYDWLNEYEGTQNNYRIEFTQKLDCLEEELQCLKNLAFSLVNEKLIEQFEESLQPKPKEGIPRKDRGSSMKSWATASELSVRYEKMKSHSKVASDTEASALKNTMSSTTTFLAQTEVSANSAMDLNEDIIYEKSLAKEDLIKKFDKELYKRVETMTKIKTDLDAVIEKWAKIWKTSNEKVLKLYKVKYDIVGNK